MEFVAVMSSVQADRALAWMLLYIGPDVFMPVLSAIAGAIGVVLMFWQRVTGLFARAWRAVFNRRG